MENTSQTNMDTRNKRGGLVAGLILIVIGAALLVQQYITFMGLVPMLLGAGFLISGILTRKKGLIIPGGIVGGVGLAITVVEQHLFNLGQPAEGGLFLLVFSTGWFAITLFTALFTSRTEWWALIPGGVMALVGSLVIMGDAGEWALKLLGQFWPLALILAGALILIGYFRKNQ